MIYDQSKNANGHGDRGLSASHKIWKLAKAIDDSHQAVNSAARKATTICCVRPVSKTHEGMRESEATVQKKGALS